MISSYIVLYFQLIFHNREQVVFSQNKNQIIQIMDVAYLYYLYCFQTLYMTDIIRDQHSGIFNEMPALH